MNKYFETIFLLKILHDIKAESSEEARIKGLNKIAIVERDKLDLLDLDNIIVVGDEGVKFYHKEEEVTAREFRENLSERKNGVLAKNLFRELYSRSPLPKWWISFIEFISRFN
jgi:hypothetical protein